MIIFLSDLHLLLKNPISRLDNTSEVQFKKFEYILKFAKETNSIILQAGDFFDRPRSWILLPKIITLLKKYNIKIFTVFGGKNHDFYYYSNETKQNTNLGILAETGLVNILSDNFIRYKEYIPNIFIYGASYGESTPLVKNKDDFNILVIHAPISENALYKGHDYINPYWFLEKNKGYKIILCGDIHRRFWIKENERHIINTGPMLRKEAIEYNFKHKPGFFFLNKQYDISWKEIPHKKSKYVLTHKFLDNAKEKKQIFDDLIFGIKKSIKKKKSFDDNLRNLISSTNDCNEKIKNIIYETLNIVS